eukprot:5058889-Alexandrium_andersonii.AAC.1
MMASEAIIAGGVRARVPVAVVGATVLCMCNERLAHVHWGSIARASGLVAHAHILIPGTSCSVLVTA